MRSRLAWLALLIAANVAIGRAGARAPALPATGDPSAPVGAAGNGHGTPVAAGGADADPGALAAGVATTPTADPAATAEERNREAVERANAGDLDRTIDLLRDARRLAPDTDLYRTNLQAALIDAAFADLRGERFRGAIARFTEALALADRGEIHRGLGYAYYRTNEPESARAELERAVAAGAADAETYLTLGRIHLDRHDQARALAMLRAAAGAGADSPGLAATIARLERDAAAEADYRALGSSHFILKIEGRGGDAAARTVLNALEDAYRRVGARFAYYPLERIEVVLYPDETFRALTGSPHWSGGIYDGRIKMPIGGLARGSERLARTVRHEYAHAAIVTLSKGKAPVWINEGLAQVAEETDDAGRSNRLRMAVAADGILPLADLASGFTRFDRDQASLAYAQAYFAAKYLLDRKGAYNVRRLLEAMATASTDDDAFRLALGMSYADFERRLRAALAAGAR